MRPKPLKLGSFVELPYEDEDGEECTNLWQITGVVFDGERHYVLADGDGGSARMPASCVEPFAK